MANSTLRLPDELDELVTEESQQMSRSKHEQILRIIKERYGLADPLPVPRSVFRKAEEIRAAREQQAA